MRTMDRVIVPFIRPIEPLLRDVRVTEIMIVGGGQRVFVERGGAVEHVSDLLLDERHLTVAIRNIAKACGGDVSPAQPLLDARLEDGARVAAVLRPVSVDGPTLTIRKHPERYSLDSLIANDTLTREDANLLVAALEARRNILISGGAGTGKTTLLNALGACIPLHDRIVLIEDTSEIHLPHVHLVRLEARRAQLPLGHEDPVPAVTISDLLRATLRHRPDRIVVGEVRGAEAFDLLQALNIGHEGTVSTLHANSAEQAPFRLAQLVLMANMGLSYAAICEAIGLAIHVVAHIVREGRRRRVAQLMTLRGYNRRRQCFEWLPTVTPIVS
jgi:pilus assembly protein CpaF